MPEPLFLMSSLCMFVKDVVFTPQLRGCALMDFYHQASFLSIGSWDENELIMFWG